MHGFEQDESIHFGNLKKPNINWIVNGSHRSNLSLNLTLQHKNQIESQIEGTRRSPQRLLDESASVYTHSSGSEDSSRGTVDYTLISSVIVRRSSRFGLQEFRVFEIN